MALRTHYRVASFLLLLSPAASSDTRTGNLRLWRRRVSSIPRLFGRGAGIFRGSIPPPARGYWEVLPCLLGLGRYRWGVPRGPLRCRRLGESIDGEFLDVLLGPPGARHYRSINSQKMCALRLTYQRHRLTPNIALLLLPNECMQYKFHWRAPQDPVQRSHHNV